MLIRSGIIASRQHWVDYSQAKDLCLPKPTPKGSPWYVVNSDDKKRARLNCIAHLLVASSL
jgi:polyphosphate kinase 2 (PPK2 family)